VLVDGRGIPLGIVTAGANCPDWDLLIETLGAVVLRRPEASPEAPQHLCADAGYDSEICWAAVRHAGYEPHIRPRRKDWEEREPHPGARPRRWVVEVSHAWLNRFRKILVRFEELEITHLALLQFACAYLVFKRGRLF